MVEEPSVEDGHDIALKLIFIFIGLFVVASFVTGLTFYDRISNYASDTNLEDPDSKEKFSFMTMLGSAFPGKDIALGQDIISKGEISVRRAPASQIIGYQKSGSKGKVVEGPSESFGRKWWRIDFEKTPDGWVDGSDINTKILLFSILNFFPSLFSIIKIILIILAILFVILLINIRLKMNKLQKKFFGKKEKETEKHVILEKTKNNISGNDLPVPNLPIGNAPKTQEAQVKNPRWENIKNLMKSHNSSDWRQGIIEADIVLDELLTKMGYQGQSIGEKLKQIEKPDFDTLDEAWSAHKIRNKIAHRGADYKLEKNEAERVIKDYKKVFEEFYYI